MRYLRDDNVWMITSEGRKAVQEAIDFLKDVEPVEPLSFSRGLYFAAQDHCEDVGPQGIFGHRGSDGSSSSDRMDRYGTRRGFSGENIQYGLEDPRDIIVGLFVDDGVAGRGHRVNIFRPQFEQVGIFTCPF